ncbi:MAG: hypothetical protein AAF399_00200 [Bacteroidota bacterium]
MKQNIFFLGLMVYSLGALAQRVVRLDTFQTDPQTSHMYLNLDLPTGEIRVQSSGICGTSYSELSAPDSQVLQRIYTHTSPGGNQMKKVSLEMTQPTREKSEVAMPGGATLRFAEQVSEVSLLEEEGTFQTAYLLDPSFSTDLYINLGMGNSELDLSGLSLQNVSVNSAFSDVFINYQEPNQVRMKELEVHTAKADIVLEQAEMANAELITIENDMGATELILGEKRLAQSTIYLQCGVGSCHVKIADGQPVHLVLRSGMFASVQVGDEFIEQKKGVFVNQSYLDHVDKQEATRIICDIDFGRIQISETR